MSGQAWFTLLTYLVVLAALAVPSASYMARIANAAPIGGVVGKFERVIYRAAAVDPAQDMPWTRYAVAVLLFNALGVLVVYLAQRLQLWLPLNPQRLANVTSDSAFNTAVSFVTNTNWQGYSGESAMSYFTQMVALAVQNFFSAATGIAVAFALIRGFARRSAQGIGNFWVDLTRSTLYILLPLSLLLAVIFMGQGVIQNFDTYKDVSPAGELDLHPAQARCRGAAAEGCARQCAHRDAHDQYANSGDGSGGLARSDQDAGDERRRLFQCQLGASVRKSDSPQQFLADDLDVFDSCRPVLRVRPHGGRFAPGLGRIRAMTVIFVVMAAVAIWAETAGQSAVRALGCGSGAQRACRPAETWRARRSRFGIVASALFATITTSASCGAVNAMHDSFTPLGGMVPMWLIELGEVVFGGVGSGLYGMLIFAIMAVFVAGLMIGRTPEYIGKKIESFEMKMTSIVILVTPFLVLVGTAIAVMAEAGKARNIQPGGARLLRDPVRPVVRVEQQRQRLRRNLRQYAFLQYIAGRGDVVRAIRLHRSGAGDRGIARRRRNASKPPPARCRPTDRCSWRCSWARWCWWGRSPMCPRSRSAR